MRLPTTPFAFIYHFVRRQWIKFVVFIIVSVIWAANETIFPYFLKRIVDTLSSYQGDPSGIYAAVSGTLFLVIFFWVLMEIFQRVQGILQIYAYPRFRSDIREAVFNYVKKHSHDYFASNFAGHIAQRLADLPTSSQNIVEMICFQFIPGAVGTLIIIVLMWLAKPIFAIILLTWLILHLGVTFLFLRKSNALWVAHSDANATLSGKIVDAFTNIANVRLFARGDFETEYLRRYQQDEMAKSRRAGWYIEVTRIALGLNGLFLVFAMIFTLLYGYAHRFVTLGDFTQIGMQTFWILNWIWFISYQLTLFVREIGTINNALNLVRRPHDLKDVKAAKKLIVPKGNIQFDDVIFTYSNYSRPVFDHLNVTIDPGEKVGLVGFSGSGKSTFVNLILRLYKLQHGRILIDGQDIANVTQDSLRQQIAMIPQDPALFHRTLMENIRYGRLDATDEEVIKAAKLAHCNEFITKLDEGYSALVGERGVKLSGGQRQRIAIARAILKNAPILILDEATSSLDSVTEKLIQESLTKLMKGRTTLVIAHRLSTIADMDRILVFDKGELIEQGTKESLLKQKGHFARLWQMQTGGFLPGQ